VEGGNFVGVEHRAARRPGRVAHVAVPILAGAADADQFSLVGDVGHDHDFRAARHAPALAEDIELDLAEAARERDLLRGRDPLIAEKDDAVFVVGVLDLSEHVVAQRLRKVHAADFRAQDGRGWNDLHAHRHRPRFASVAILMGKPGGG
jgi:hypothetical protein